MTFPHNKIKRIAINVGLVVVWYFIACVLPFPLGIVKRAHLNNWEYIDSLPYYIVLLFPIAFVTGYIWWGRGKLRQRITRTREEELAGKKWDAVVDELMNRI